MSSTHVSALKLVFFSQFRQQDRSSVIHWTIVSSKEHCSVEFGIYLVCFQEIIEASHSGSETDRGPSPLLPTQLFHIFPTSVCK